MQQLANKRIVLGITGGIAAYKAAELTRKLKDAGAEVRVVMTAGAQEFITPLSLQALSGNPVGTSLLDPEAEAAMGHIQFARWADLVLVAPASANFISRLASGQADDLLTTLVLATNAPVAIAPAMNQAMWADPATQANIETLKNRGILQFGPASGEQACGDTGPGRMLEALELRDLAAGIFTTGRLAGKRVVINAGPTREALDPVRYISNHSSGKMGYALAVAAFEAGATVTLVSGPVNIPAPEGIDIVHVSSALEMLAACTKAAASCDIFIATAAVADYRPVEQQVHKIKKSSATLQLELCKNPDIVASISNSEPRPFTVGFAAETKDLASYARGKLERKNLDLVIANNVALPGIGFNSDENSVLAVWQDGEQQFEQTSKAQLARQLVDLIANRYSATNRAEV